MSLITDTEIPGMPTSKSIAHCPRVCVIGMEDRAHAARATGAAARGSLGGAH